VIKWKSNSRHLFGSRLTLKVVRTVKVRGTIPW
jgi:hypothetical protein